MIVMRSAVRLLGHVDALGRRKHLGAGVHRLPDLVGLHLQEDIGRAHDLVAPENDLGPGHVHRALVPDKPQEGAARRAVHEVHP